MEHAEQFTAKVIGVLGACDIGELLSEVTGVLTSGLSELSVDIQDMALVGEESSTEFSLLVEDQGAGESRVGGSGVITSNPQASDLDAGELSNMSPMSCFSNMFSTSSTTTM